MPGEQSTSRGAPQLARRVGAVCVVVAVGCAGFVPLMARPGYELALVAGLLVPSIAAVTSAIDLASRPRNIFDTFCRALFTGVVLAVAAYLAAFAHGLRNGFCDLRQGTLLFVLGPMTGTVLGSLWGALASEVAWRRKRVRLWAALLAVLGPLGSALLQLGWFYNTPMVFAYDPFVGYFSGSLYDTIVNFDGLYRYRAATLATRS